MTKQYDTPIGPAEPLPAPWAKFPPRVPVGVHRVIERGCVGNDFIDQYDPIPYAWEVPRDITGTKYKNREDCVIACLERDNFDKRFPLKMPRSQREIDNCVQLMIPVRPGWVLMEFKDQKAE